MFHELLADFQHRLFMFALVVGILTPLELTLSHEKHSLRSRLWPVAYWALWTLAVMTAAELFSHVWHPGPLITVDVNRPWGKVYEYVGAPVLAAIVGDFYFYFHHRIQHAVPLLWRFHAVHHSVRNLNAINNYHHLFDDFIKGVIGLVSLSLLLVKPVNAVPAMILIFALHPAYLHSPILADLGKLRWIFGDNLAHRVHHSLEPRHFDRNFGAFTTLWDRLFGTYYEPEKGEWPAVGLAGVDEPKNVWEWLTFPWRYGRRRDGVVPAE